MSAAWSISSLISATLVTLATRWANLHVEIDSSVCARPGCIVATMTVLQLPPSESRSTCGHVGVQPGHVRGVGLAASST